MDKSAGAFRTISEVADDLDVPQHVLRFWETRFTQIKPLKRAGGRRFYRPDDVALLQAIRQLLYGQGYTIKGVQRILKEQGVRAVLAGHVGAPTDAAERAPSTPEVEAMSDFADADEISGESLETQGMSAAHAAVLETILADLAECQHMLDVARR